MICKAPTRPWVSPRSASGVVRAWRQLLRGCPKMPYQIRKAAVLGAGVMGAAIAAHLANVGIPSLLLDSKKDRDKVARMGLEKAINARPAAFYSKRAAKLVTVGNIEDDLEELADVDWIIEAVIERLDIKRQLYIQLEQVLTPGTIIS